MRILICFSLVLGFLCVGCQIKTIQSAPSRSTSSTPAAARPVAAREVTSPPPVKAGPHLIAGRVTSAKDCHVHVEFLAVEVAGPEPSAKAACSSPVTSTGRYTASCDLKKGNYTLRLRNTRDGRTLRSQRLSGARAGVNEIDFELCGVLAAELAQPEAVPGAPKSDESSFE